MDFVKYISVVAMSMLKFIGGVLTGLVLKLSFVETFILSVIGMMLTVILVLFVSNFLQMLSARFFPKKEKPKRFSKLTRLGIRIRKKFGLMGIAFLTPILFTPPLGTVLAMAFRYSKQAIFLQMLFSAVVWGIVLTLFFYYVKDLIF